jgi:hypothetical protein
VYSKNSRFSRLSGHVGGGGQVSAAPRQESQEEILEAALASLTDEDIPPDDDELYGWPGWMARSWRNWRPRSLHRPPRRGR